MKTLSGKPIFTPNVALSVYLDIISNKKPNTLEIFEKIVPVLYSGLFKISPKLTSLN